MTEVISLAQIAENTPSNDTDFCSNGDYMLRHFAGDRHATKSNVILPQAVKIDGISIFMCTKGESKITINFHRDRLCAGSIIVLSPNDVIEPDGDTLSNVEGYAIFLPMEFVKLLSLDSNTLNYSNIALDVSPMIQLDDDNLRLFEGYFNLLELNATINRESSVYTRNISRSVVGAMLYQLMAFAEVNSVSDTEEDTRETGKNTGRRRYYVKDFMSLLQQDYKQHRSVGHYAEKLFISAKYLSLIIKEATGRTATEWIDHFVILEAKNLLRYSGRNIQQIAYDLNFHNQSAFGKYFKQLTGMSPSDFRKT